MNAVFSDDPWAYHDWRQTAPSNTGTANGSWSVYDLVEPFVRGGSSFLAGLYSSSAGFFQVLDCWTRVVEAKTGLIHTVAGDGGPGEGQDVGDGGPATSAHLNMPSDVEFDSRTGDIYIADMHHNRVRKVDAKTHIITTVAGSGVWGYSGDNGRATQARLAGPAGIAIVAEPGGKVTIFIADYYNGHVRAVGPDGIIRDLSGKGRTAFGAPTRVAFAATGPRRGWLYVTDSSRDRIVVLNVPQIAPNVVPPRPARKAGA